jgi:hypothetical protein
VYGTTVALQAVCLPLAERKLLPEIGIGVWLLHGRQLLLLLLLLLFSSLLWHLCCC